MDAIKVKNLELGRKLGEGFFSTVKTVSLNGEIFAYKEFKEEFVDWYDIDALKKKYTDLNNLKLKGSIIPCCFVNDDNNDFKGYLTHLSDGKTFNMAYSLPINTKLDYLWNVKRNFDEMHDAGIIHTDLYSSNIILYGGYLIDFDNCAYKDYPVNSNLLSTVADYYLANRELDEGLDYFMFNIFTYRLLNNIIINDENEDNYSVFDLNEFGYGVFDFKEGRKICDNLDLHSDYPCKELLYDKIMSQRNLGKIKFPK